MSTGRTHAPTRAGTVCGIDSRMSSPVRIAKMGREPTCRDCRAGYLRYPPRRDPLAHLSHLKLLHPPRNKRTR